MFAFSFASSGSPSLSMSSNTDPFALLHNEALDIERFEFCRDMLPELFALALVSALSSLGDFSSVPTKFTKSIPVLAKSVGEP